MGQYHYLVNLDKKEIVHPHQIGNGLKLYEQIQWPYSTSTVLVMLLASSSKAGGRGGGDFRSGHRLIGSWAGNRIAFIGDYSEPDDIPRINAQRIYEQSSAACCPGSTDQKPKGWQRWKNISADVRAMMSAEFEIEYDGTGWMEIRKKGEAKVKHPIAPDLVLTVSSETAKKE